LHSPSSEFRAITGRAQLAFRVVNGPMAGRVYAIGDNLILGRTTNCDIFIPDSRMSRRHARIFFEADAIYLEDLGSHNGSFVNGERIGTSLLRVGDELRCGSTELRLILKSQAPITHPVVVMADSDALQPQVVRPVDSQQHPDLSRMGVEDYWEAIGVADIDVARGAQKDRVEFLAQQARNFAMLYEVAKALQSYSDVQSLLELVMDFTFKLVRAERGAILLVDPRTQELTPRVVRYRDPEPDGSGERPELVLSRTVLGLVMDNRAAVITSDALTDERFSGSGSVLLNNIHSLMCVPMIVGNRSIGLIQVDNLHSIVVFTENDLNLVTVIASLASIALENARLYEAQSRTIAELRAAQEELVQTQERLVRSEQMAVVGRLASGIAHEVRNHLGPFMLADLLAMKYPDDSEVQEATELMLDATSHITGLINEIQAFARTGGTGPHFEKSAVDLGALCRDTIRFLRCDRRIKAANVTVEVLDQPVVHGDPDRLRQVLVNLVRNAVESTGDVGGEVVVTVSRAGEVGVVDVRDNGCGIAPEVADRIFEPLFSTKGERGLGLGLDISRKIVLGHNGTLTFETVPGQGTTFRVRLPIEQVTGPALIDGGLALAHRDGY